MEGNTKQREQSDKRRYEPELDEQEEGQVEDLRRADAPTIHVRIRRDGEEELRRPASALAWSALAAGLSMGFSMVADGLIHAHLPDALWRPLLSNLGYSVGFLIVILGRQQLFTENTLTAVLPVLANRSGAALLGMLRLWGIVLVLNLIGTLLFALVIAYTGVFPDETERAFIEISTKVIEGGFWPVLLRAIFAGWLIALMVWLLPGANSSRVAIIIIITYLVGLGGLTHSIAGSVEVLHLVLSNEASWGTYFGGFLVPAVLGNIIGGVSLVAALNHAQVAADKG